MTESIGIRYVIPPNSLTHQRKEAFFGMFMLVECGDCGKEISASARACPGCGKQNAGKEAIRRRKRRKKRRRNRKSKKEKEEEDRKKYKSKIIEGRIFAILSTFITALILYGVCNPGSGWGGLFLFCIGIILVIPASAFSTLMKMDEFSSTIKADLLEDRESKIYGDNFTAGHVFSVKLLLFTALFSFFVLIT